MPNVRIEGRHDDERVTAEPMMTDGRTEWRPPRPPAAKILSHRPASAVRL